MLIESWNLTFNSNSSNNNNYIMTFINLHFTWMNQLWWTCFFQIVSSIIVIAYIILVYFLKGKHLYYYIVEENVLRESSTKTIITQWSVTVWTSCTSVNKKKYIIRIHRIRIICYLTGGERGGISCTKSFSKQNWTPRLD